MTILPTRLVGVVVIEPRAYRDRRGYLLETWRRDRYQAAGLPAEFLQDNLVESTRGVLRGLHYQHPSPQGKLVYAVQGEVFDVAVDIRRGSPTWGQWVGEVLSAENLRQMYVPPGFAHGYVVTTEMALVAYKCTAVYEPACDRCLRWDDPDLGIAWPITAPVFSDKDACAPRLRDIPADQLPEYVP